MDPALADEMYSREDIKTPHQLWNLIEELNKQSREPQLKDLRMQFVQFTWTNRDVTANYNRFSTILNEPRNKPNNTWLALHHAMTRLWTQSTFE